MKNYYDQNGNTHQTIAKLLTALVTVCALASFEFAFSENSNLVASASTTSKTVNKTKHSKKPDKSDKKHNHKQKKNKSASTAYPSQKGTDTLAQARKRQEKVKVHFEV